ncbi:hypothetical protein KI387_019817, partial [Taxus chinensis]
EACEREIDKKITIAKSMVLRREMTREGFKDHTKDVEPEHHELPHVGKHDRDLPLASCGSMLAETTWATGTHLNPPGDLAFVLGFPVSSTTSNQQASLGSKRASIEM